MGTKLTFVCWKWDSTKHPHPRKKRRAFTSQHVNILYGMLYRNLSLPFRLICVTDDPVGIRPEVEIVSIWNEFRELGGCFLRLVPFKKEFDLFGEQFISIDLDCVILRDITDLFTRDEEFVIWHPRKAVRWLDRGEKGRYYCGSLWMLKAGTRSIVYDRFNPKKWSLNREGRYEGGTDQKHISTLLYPNEACWTIDDGVCLFVEDIARAKKGTGIKNPRLVFFNGRFMPDDPECERFDWIREHYHDGLEKKVNVVSEDEINILREDIPFPKKVATDIGKVSIIAFYWGDWPEKKDGLGMQYVNMLYNGVKKHIPEGQNYEFVLFTDNFVHGKVSDNIIVKPLKVPKDLKWNLKKLFMFSRKSELVNPTICFDLDTVIVGDLSPMISRVLKLVGEDKIKILTCEDAYAIGRAGGSIVAFNPSPELEEVLWSPILSDRREGIERATGGSERFYYRQKSKFKELAIEFWERTMPGFVLSYKKDCRGTHVRPKKVSVIRFHGKPRPHQLVRGWIKEAMRYGK